MCRVWGKIIPQRFAILRFYLRFLPWVALWLLYNMLKGFYYRTYLDFLFIIIIIFVRNFMVDDLYYDETYASRLAVTNSNFISLSLEFKSGLRINFSSKWKFKFKLYNLLPYLHNIRGICFRLSFQFVFPTSYVLCSLTFFFYNTNEAIVCICRI